MTKQNSFLPEYMSSFEVLDKTIDQILADFNLTRTTNSYFLMAKQGPQINLDSAIKLAVNWREITKQFLFTVLTGLGTLADKMRNDNSPAYDLIAVLQNGINVISDDLSNICPILGEVAPKGPEGAHYIWWENSILNTMTKIASQKNFTINRTVTAGVQKLLSYMVELTKLPLGAAVQLRIVEAIAMDIAVAFRSLYSLLTIDGKKVFPGVNDLAWVNAHIKAEVNHHKQVKDGDSGMVNIATTPEEQRTLLVLTKKYAECWALALKDFEQIVTEGITTTPLMKACNEAQDAPLLQERQFRQWYCLICDFIYDEALGLPDEGIPAGTLFEDIPNDWSCSDCNVSKRDFALLTKPGENLQLAS